VAIVQISRITNRKGLTENLPQLSGGEFGWCLDSRRLFIGNGTLDEGAPVIGNTEILTEFSDITAYSFYTYEDITVGYSAQTGPSASDPVVRTVQAKLDDFASVRDFGATGDGLTDDTAAINRALFQLYCRETNTQIRRTLYFPAGTYRVTDTINIPTYAKLVGEGANCTIIQLQKRGDDTYAAYTARYVDSKQQSGINVGTNGATAPRYIEISGMSFESQGATDVFLIESATQCQFNQVGFVGNLTQLALEDSGSEVPDDVACVRFSSYATPVIQVNFSQCSFTNCTYAMKTDQNIRGVTVNDSRFSTLYQAVYLEANAEGGEGPTGFRVLHNMFDIIFAEALIFQNVSLNISAYNTFYNVGNSVGSTAPTFPAISFTNESSVSINDMFARSPANARLIPNIRVTTGETFVGSTLQQMGSYQRTAGISAILENATFTATPVIELNSEEIQSLEINYRIRRGTDVRYGKLSITAGPDDSSAPLTWSDEYTQNADIGVALSVTQVSNQLTVDYTTTATGVSASISYSISNLD
jgi:hypothetical protein